MPEKITNFRYMRGVEMDVFDSIAVGTATVKNRFARSATWEGMATPEGAVTPELTRLMKTLAEGGTGLLFSSHAYIRKDGQASLKQLGIYDDALIPGLSEMRGAARATGALVFAQLAHGGANANRALSGFDPVAPGVVENAQGDRSRAMSEEDIAVLAQDFAKAAIRAVKAGFDGVQIHAAHGYCLGEFLSPYYNKRTDRYGGSVENRARALIEVYRAVREAVGKGYPVTAKINSDDFIDGGLTPPMMAETSALMESEGLDGMEVSGGGGPAARYSSHRPGDLKTPGEEAYYRDAARLYKSQVKKCR